MDQHAPRWVRIGLLVALAPTQIVTGLWALFAPSGFFDHFPGFGPALVAAHPPFNSHLASDAGAGFLATGVALAAAAIWARRSGVYVALLAYLAATVPHLVFHAAIAAGTAGAQAVTVTALSGGVVIALLLAWGARRPTAEPRSQTEPRKTVAVVTVLAVVGVLGTAGAALASAASGRSSGPDHTYGGGNPFAAASAQVHVRTTGNGHSLVSLHLTGVAAPAGQTFGAHVHVNPCGTAGIDAGGHYQHAGVIGALEERELWLDFSVNPSGNAHAQAVRPWVLNESTPRSVILHAGATDPSTGLAGPRLAWIDLDGVHP